MAAMPCSPGSFAVPFAVAFGWLVLNTSQPSATAAAMCRLRIDGRLVEPDSLAILMSSPSLHPDEYVLQSKPEWSSSNVSGYTGENKDQIFHPNEAVCVPFGHISRAKTA
jgi:hypothetical protein